MHASSVNMSNVDVQFVCKYSVRLALLEAV